MADVDAMLRKLEWTVIRRLDGIMQGDYRTVFRGAGLDLADLREYQLHDDVRHIDWNVTARLQQPYVRQFTEDREITGWFVLDLSGSVHFGSGDTSKMAVAEGFVAALARLLTRHGNRVGAFRYASKVDGRLPPGSGRLHVLRMMAMMRQQAAEGADAASGRSKAPNKRRRKGNTDRIEGTKLADLLQAAESGIRRRSMVFIVSDFISEPGWQASLGRLAQRHDVLAVRLYDPLELDLPDLGLVTVEDAETGEQMFIDTHDPAFRSRYGEIASADEQALRDDLSRTGVDVLELRTDDDLLDSLMRFTDLRRRRVRLVRSATAETVPQAPQPAAA
jgi:uncharacterized protein (DUF58 family)